MYSKRKLGGKIAKIEGDKFENLLKSFAACSKILCLQIPNGAKTIRIGPKLILQRVKSPFDFVLIKGEKVVFCDAKSINANSFPRSLVNHSQVNHFLDILPHGHKAGYIIHFRKMHKVCFIDALFLSKLRKGESVQPNHGIDLGSSMDIKLGALFENQALAIRSTSP